MTVPYLSGWIELDGKAIRPSEIGTFLEKRPEDLRHCGGEFYLSWDGCSARDHFGIMEGTGPIGAIQCNGEVLGEIVPRVPEVPLEEAIITAVRLRSDEGVVALSGGVDSTLVACLAKRECIAVGFAGSHDLKRARYVAETLGLSCTYETVTECAVEAALPLVVSSIPRKDPVSTSIALTQFFIARRAEEQGYHRIITGQGADELFGGYSRYSTTDKLAEDLEHDIAGLAEQVRRDQAVAALHNAYLSMPYLDYRVVRAALAIPAVEKVDGDRRKIPLRTVAERYIPQDLAWYGKKAMQYGSGIWPALRKLARKNGYKTSVQDYIDQIIRVEHGH